MNTNKSNHDDSTIYTVTAGDQDKEWTVEILEDEFIVHYPNKNKSQVVELYPHHCTGTNFQYNDKCPHVEAAMKAKWKMEDEKIGAYDYVDCPLCGEVHAGECHMPSSQNLR